MCHREDTAAARGVYAPLHIIVKPRNSNVKGKNMMELNNLFLYTTRILLILFSLQFFSVSGVHAQGILTLDKALEIASENSPDIKRTSLNLERSREMLNAQNARLKSQFRLTLNPFTYSRDKTFNNSLSSWISTDSKSSQGTFTISQPIKQTDGTLSLNNRFSWQDSFSDFRDIRDKAFNNNLYLSFDQPIFTYNRTKLELRELELDLESTTLTFAIQKLSLERQVTQSFYSVYQNKSNLDITKEELRNNEQNYEIIKNKVDAGLLALEEIYQAELNLATSKSSVQNREVSLENALDNFKLLIGLPLSQTLIIEAEISTEPVEVDLDKALQNALKSRMELRQNQINLENAQFALIRTEAQNEFRGNLSLSYGLTGNDENLTNIYDAPTNRQAVGISLEIPLWDWGEKESRVKATQATIKRQALTLDDERNNITLAIREQYRNLQNLVNQIEISRQSVRNAELTYEINVERYKNGDLTGMDLNLFQTQLSQRRISLAQTQIDYKLALLNMKIISLYDFERNQPVIPDDIIGN